MNALEMLGGAIGFTWWSLVWFFFSSDRFASISENGSKVGSEPWINLFLRSEILPSNAISDFRPIVEHLIFFSLFHAIILLRKFGNFNVSMGCFEYNILQRQSKICDFAYNWWINIVQFVAFTVGKNTWIMADTLLPCKCTSLHSCPNITISWYLKQVI